MQKIFLMKKIFDHDKTEFEGILAYPLKTSVFILINCMGKWHFSFPINVFHNHVWYETSIYNIMSGTEIAITGIRLVSMKKKLCN